MSLTDQAAGVGQEVGQALGRKAEDLVDRSKGVGADAVAGAARTAEKLADTVADQSPAIADYVRNAGQKIDRLASDLREKSVGDLLGQAAGYAKSQPLVVIAGAAIVGFALSRLIKAGASVAGSTAEKPGPGDAA